MNIAVVLNYFEYFTHFPGKGEEHKYFFVTSNRKYLSSGIRPLAFCDWKDYVNINQNETSEKWEEYFKVIVKLELGNRNVLPRVARHYEIFFENYFKNNKIDLLLTGGVTGFERCGLETARQNGIKALCVWEGFFRPNTLSIDREGMNAESSFYRKRNEDLKSHVSSKNFKEYYENFIKSKIHSLNDKNVLLKKIQGDRFKILKQATNRFKDRRDLERIRLPLYRHALSRLNYYAYAGKYSTFDQMKKPFIFFPLQTHTDSNIALNSSLIPYRKYVDLVLESFRLVKKEITCELVLKEHPLDIFRTSYHKKNGDGIYWLHPATSVKEILANNKCLGTLVVNSTVGFESLLFNKPVVILGDAIYDKNGLTIKPESLNAESISESLEKLVGFSVDPAVVYLFASYLYDEIEIQGNLDLVPDQLEIIDFEKRMTKLNNIDM